MAAQATAAVTTWQRTRVAGERNLYLAGRDYWACATAPGERQASWRKIGAVGVMQARRARDEFVAQVRRGEVSARAGAKLRVSALVGLYLDRCRQRVAAGTMTERTWEGYEIALRLHFVPDFGTRLGHTIDADDLVLWQDRQRAAGYAATTIRGRWTAVRAMLGYAARRGHLLSNPADTLTRDEVPPTGGAAVRWLTRAEMGLVLDAAPERFRAALATMMFTGLRASEMLGLTWRDVDFDQEVIHARYQMRSRGKNPDRVKLKTDAAERRVILIPQLAAVLAAHKLRSPWSGPDDLVFTSTVGTTMTYRRLCEAVRKTRDAAGLDGVGSHTLRHTFASILIYQGRDVVFVQRQLGHSRPATTLNVYSHMFDAARTQREAREQFGQEFGGMLDASFAGQPTEPTKIGYQRIAAAVA